MADAADLLIDECTQRARTDGHVVQDGQHRVAHAALAAVQRVEQRVRRRGAQSAQRLGGGRRFGLVIRGQPLDQPSHVLLEPCMADEAQHGSAYAWIWITSVSQEPVGTSSHARSVVRGDVCEHLGGVHAVIGIVEPVRYLCDARLPSFHVAGSAWVAVIRCEQRRAQRLECDVVGAGVVAVKGGCQDGIQIVARAVWQAGMVQMDAGGEPDGRRRIGQQLREHVRAVRPVAQ